MQQSSVHRSAVHLFLSHQWFIVSCAFSCVLLLGRMIVTDSDVYCFLAWNLFLAFIPYVISYKIAKDTSILKNKRKLFLLLGLWLLFIPNTFYILTDLFHLRDIYSAPGWFDLLLLLSFAWNGLLLGILSLKQVETVIQQVWGRKFSLLIVFIVMCLNALGIYIGRYLRYNSWDVIAQPFSLLRDMVEMIFHPFDNKMEWGMISCYAVFMTLLYVTISRLAEQFAVSTDKSIKQNQ